MNQVCLKKEDKFDFNIASAFVIVRCFFRLHSITKQITYLGGGGTPFWTLKHRPWACLGPWYGSWPKMTTFTSRSSQWCVQEYTCSAGGKIVDFLRSPSRKRLSCVCGVKISPGIHFNWTKSWSHIQHDYQVVITQ